jgi:DNA polymerase-2
MSVIPGFLLTRHWRDNHELELVFWACSPEGPLRLVFPRQHAVCFIARDALLELANTPSIKQRTELPLQAFDGAELDALYFRRQRDLQQFRERMYRQHIRLYESDVKPHDRFLMERFITAPFQVLGQPVQKPGYLELVNPRLRPTDFEPEFSYLSLDIETDGIDGEILSIAMSNDALEVILMRGQTVDWCTDLPIRWYPDEHALLEGFFQAFRALDPDLILGWNLINFDLDYIERRCRRYNMPFALGRGSEHAAILQPRQTGQNRIASIPGRVALDGIDNLRTAFWNFDSFELGLVAHQLLGRKKLIEDPDNKIKAIQRLFREDRPSLAAYNLEDCRLVDSIFKQTDLINFAVQRAKMTGLSLGRQGGSVASFDNLYLPRLHRAGAVAHDVGAVKHKEHSPGGYVMASQPGLYDNVLVLDFKSLYPSIIRTFQVDPFGLTRPGENPVPGFLHAAFSRTESILPGIIKELWLKRDEAKRQNNRSLSQAVKIIMNSFYGVLGSSGCRFFDPRLASSITRRGHEIIQRSRDYIEQQGHRVIYGDTDSVFVLLGPGYTEDRARQSGIELARALNRWWSHRITQEFDLVSHLEIEFETHFIRFLMPKIRGSDTGSKKRYAGYIRNAKGKFDLVFKGLESVRSDWTPLAQEFQRELYRRVFFEEPWERFVADTVEQLRSGKLDAQLVYRKRLRQPLESYRRNVPPHVQAARKMKNPGRWISYVVTVNGPEPVSNRLSPADYQHYLDRQLKPVADGILQFIGGSFDRFSANQMALF